VKAKRRLSPPLAVGLVAVAAILLLVELRSATPPRHTEGTRGGEGGLELMLFAPAPVGVASVPERGSVSAGAALHFRVRSASPCHLWILAVDGTGAAHRLYPQRGDGGWLVGAGEQDLPGGALLDLSIGPERVYAICTAHALPWTAAEASVRAAIARPSSVQLPTPLAALPTGAAWQSILLEKQP